MNIEKFAAFDVGAWLLGDGVTSRHIPAAKAEAESARTGRVGNAAFALGAAAVFTIVSIAHAGDSATMLSFAVDNLVPAKPREKSSFGGTSRLLASLDSAHPIAVSAETLSLARRAIGKKVDFSKESVVEWAKNLVHSSIK